MATNRFDTPVTITPQQTYISQFVPTPVDYIKQAIGQKQQDADLNRAPIYAQQGNLAKMKSIEEQDAARTKIIEDYNKEANELLQSGLDPSSSEYQAKAIELAQRYAANPNIQSLQRNVAKKEQDMKTMRTLEANGKLSKLQKDFVLNRYKDLKEESDKFAQGERDSLPDFGNYTIEGMMDYLPTYQRAINSIAADSWSVKSMFGKDGELKVTDNGLMYKVEGSSWKKVSAKKLKKVALASVDSIMETEGVQSRLRRDNRFGVDFSYSEQVAIANDTSGSYTAEEIAKAKEMVALAEETIANELVSFGTKQVFTQSEEADTGGLLPREKSGGGRGATVKAIKGGAKDYNNYAVSNNPYVNEMELPEIPKGLAVPTDIDEDYYQSMVEPLPPGIDENPMPIIAQKTMPIISQLNEILKLGNTNSKIYMGYGQKKPESSDETEWIPLVDETGEYTEEARKYIDQYNEIIKDKKNIQLTARTVSTGSENAAKPVDLSRTMVNGAVVLRDSEDKLTGTEFTSIEQLEQEGYVVKGAVQTGSTIFGTTIKHKDGSGVEVGAGAQVWNVTVTDKEGDNEHTVTLSVNPSTLVAENFKGQQKVFEHAASYQVGSKTFRLSNDAETNKVTVTSTNTPIFDDNKNLIDIQNKYEVPRAGLEQIVNVVNARARRSGNYSQMITLDMLLSNRSRGERYVKDANTKKTVQMIEFTAEGIDILNRLTHGFDLAMLGTDFTEGK